MVKSIVLSIVADELTDKETALEWAQKIIPALPEHAMHTNIVVYPKFQDAYKIEFEIPLPLNLSNEALLHCMCYTASQLAMPWSLYYDEAGYNTELIFNRTEHSKYTETYYTHIRWAQLQFIY